MITLEMTPVPKPRMTQRDRWAKRPAVLRYFAYCDELRKLWSQALEGDNMWGDSVFQDGAVPSRLYIIFAMPMPKSWSARKRLQMRDMPHQQRPDIDNLLKAFLDCLCEDDSYVHEVHAVKVWSDDPHITVSVL